MHIGISEGGEIMLSIIYVSTAADDFDYDALAALTQQANGKNNTNDITGMLVYNGELFMQLLEGEEERVAEILDIISKDKRHTNVTIIRKQDIVTRECPDWSMRAFTMKLHGDGATEVFKSLPETMRADTKTIFTSFATISPYD